MGITYYLPHDDLFTFSIDKNCFYCQVLYKYSDVGFITVSEEVIGTSKHQFNVVNDIHWS